MPSFCMALRLFFSLRLCLPRAPSSPAAVVGQPSVGHQADAGHTLGTSTEAATPLPAMRHQPPSTIALHTAHMRSRHSAGAAPMPPRQRSRSWGPLPRTGLIQVRHVVVIAANLVIDILLHLLLHQQRSESGLAGCPGCLALTLAPRGSGCAAAGWAAVLPHAAAGPQAPRSTACRCQRSAGMAGAAAGRLGRLSCRHHVLVQTCGQPLACPSSCSGTALCPAPRTTVSLRSSSATAAIVTSCC